MTLHQVVIDVPEGGEAELREALDHAAEYARVKAQDAPLRSQDPQTRRYAWWDVSTELHQAGR